MAIMNIFSNYHDEPVFYKYTNLGMTIRYLTLKTNLNQEYLRWELFQCNLFSVKWLNALLST